MIVDFNNFTSIDGHKDALVFYTNGADEYAYIIPDDDKIHYKSKDKFFLIPKNRIKEFIVDRYNETMKQYTGQELLAKSERSIPYLELYLVRYKIPAIIYLGYIKGLQWVFNQMKIKYQVADTSDKVAFFSTPIILHSDKKVLNIYTDDKRQEYMVNGLKKMKIKGLEFNNLNDREPFAKLIEDKFGKKALKDLELFEDKIIDPVTAEWLEGQNYSTRFSELIVGAALDKLLNAKIENPTDPRNARIRLGEAVLDIVYAQLMQAARAAAEGTKPKIELDPKYITDQLTASGLVHYTKSLSPLDEMVQSRKVTKSGVGNMKSDIIPLAQRDVVPDATAGVMSPTQSHEYTKIGVVHGMTLSTNFTNKYGEVQPDQSDKPEPHKVLSANELMTSPFINLNDTTRNVMGNQQASQYMELNNPDIPLVQTGYEALAPELVSDRFSKKAPCDGKIVKIEPGKYIKVECDNGKTQIINIQSVRSRTKRGIYMNKEYKVQVSNGQKVKEGDILAVTPSLQHGLLTPGKNAVIAIMGYNGENFEDGFVVTEQFLGKYTYPKIEKITVLVTPDVKVEQLEDHIGKITKPGDTLVKLKFGDEFLSNIDNIDELEDISNQDSDVFKGLKKTGKGEAEYLSPGGKLVDIVIKMNDDKAIDPKVKVLYKSLIKHLKETEEMCKQAFTPGSRGFNECAYSHENSIMLKIGDHKVNGSDFEGALIEFYIEQQESGSQSSKLVLGATGAKGTVQYIIPKDKTPVAEDTKLPIDIIVSPLSIFARKSLAVMMLLWTGKLTYFMNLKAKELAKSGNAKKVYEFVKKFYQLTDFTDDQSIVQSFEESWNPKTDLNKIANMDPFTKPYYPMIAPPFKNNIGIKDLEPVAKWLGVPLEEKVEIKEGDYTTDKSVPVGIIPVIMLEHMPESMANAVSMSKKSSFTGQGLAGTKEGSGALSTGQYDITSLLTYGNKAEPLIKEFSVYRSDDPVAEKALVRDIIKNGGKPVSQNELPNSISKTEKLVEIYSLGAGIEL